jgi:hypothetical protein
MAHRSKPTPDTRGHRPSEGVGFTASCRGANPTRTAGPTVKAYPGVGTPQGLHCAPVLDYRSRGRKVDPKQPHTATPIPGVSSGLGSPQSGGPIPAPTLPALVIDRSGATQRGAR